TLLSEQQFPLIHNGTVSGTTTLPPGSRVGVSDIRPQTITIRYGGTVRELPHSDTDILARARTGMEAPSPQPVRFRPQVRRQEASAFRQTQARPTGAFVHPGMLHTEADFDRMRRMVRLRKSPWIEAWEKLESSRFAQPDIQPRATEVIIRENVPGQNVALLYMDVAAAYQLALRWKISGKKEYAEAAIRILNAWGSTLKSVQGNADR